MNGMMSYMTYKFLVIVIIFCHLEDEPYLCTVQLSMVLGPIRQKLVNHISDVKISPDGTRESLKWFVK